MKIQFLSMLALVALLSCSSGSDNDAKDNNKDNNEIVEGTFPFETTDETLTPTPAFENLSIDNAIKIEFKNGSEPNIDNPYSDDVLIEKNGENVVITIKDATEYNFILSGTTTNGSLKIYGDVRKGLYLNGVRITNNSGPAINIQKSKRINVHLVNGTENYLADGATYSEPPSGEQAKGTFFSEGKLNFDGSGSLEVIAKRNHAIVVDNDIEINNGKITVSEAANDGIHANDIIEIKGGVLKITSIGDGIQSERDQSSVAVKITGGKIAASTAGIKSHGITSEGPVSISENAVVQISVSGDGSKGIKSSRYVEFVGGTTAIKTSGKRHIDNSLSPPDTSTAAGVKLDADLFIEGGELTIKSEGDKAKGINVSGNAYIRAGKVNIEADDDGVKVHGNLNITGGEIYVKSKKKDAFDVVGNDSRTGGSVEAIDGGERF